MATRIFKSVADIFRPTTQVSVANPMAQNNPGADPSSVPGAGTSKPVTEQAAANPLDQFTPLWQTDPKSAPAADPLKAPLLNADAKAIAEAASKIDFTSQINPELLTKAMSGNDPQAFAQVLNAVAQNTLATSTQLNAATIEQATQKNNARLTQVIPGQIKQAQLDAIQSENPALQHPASQPFLQLVRSQIQMKNPGMSAVEINKQAESALTAFASQLVAPPAAEVAAATNKAAGTDWDSWVAT